MHAAALEFADHGARPARRAARTACAASAARRRARSAPYRSRAAQTAGAAICRRASSGRCWRGRRRSSPRSRRRSAWSASISRRTAATFASVCGRREPRGRDPSTGAGPSARRSGLTLRRIMEGRARFITRLYSYSRAEAIALFAVEIEVRRRSRMGAAKSGTAFPDRKVVPGFRFASSGLQAARSERGQFVKLITQMLLVTPTPMVFQSGVSMFWRWPEESIHRCRMYLAPPSSKPLHAGVFAEATARERGFHAGVVVGIVMEKPASFPLAQVVGPILRFAADGRIQLDGLQSVLRAILIHKTAHEPFVVGSGTIRVANLRRWRRALRGLGLLGVLWVLRPGSGLKLWIGRVAVGSVTNIAGRSSESVAVRLKDKKQRTGKQQSKFPAFKNCHFWSSKQQGRIKSA